LAGGAGVGGGPTPASMAATSPAQPAQRTPNASVNECIVSTAAGAKVSAAAGPPGPAGSVVNCEPSARLGLGGLPAAMASHTDGTSA